MKLATLRIKNFKCFEDTGEIELDQINLLIGKNNSGKSTLIQAVHFMQTETLFTQNYIRLEADQCEIAYGLENVGGRHSYINSQGATPALQIGLKVARGSSSVQIIKGTQSSSGGSNVPLFHRQEPDNFLYTYLSKRKVINFVQTVNLANTQAITDNLSNLVAKVARLANPDHPKYDEYSKLCNVVLGFTISEHAALNGQQAGIPVGSFDYIPIEEMGEGVSSLLGLITDLCMADGNLFLIEELENDIHPEGLKAMLEVIGEKAKTNQFIISTHSNIVVKYLGAHPNSKLFNVSQEYKTNSVPTSFVKEIENSTHARIQVLRQLGYELYDFDAWEGWLILEEASAESIIRNYLIPWFAPKLTRIQIVSARGNKNVEPTFNDFHRLFLFAHLEPSLYKDRAWVIIDGDTTGNKIIDDLRKQYSSWTPNQFRTWNRENFEGYYPERFKQDVEATLSATHGAKQKKKGELLNRVINWCDNEPVEAKKEFEKSACEVVAFLKEIERALFEN